MKGKPATCLRSTFYLPFRVSSAASLALIDDFTLWEVEMRNPTLPKEGGIRSTSRALNAVLPKSSLHVEALA